MDIIVLGLLMIQKCTIYEMKKAIETNLTNISSNSTGSIQAAVKKMLDKHMIFFNEYVENSINKKVYEITDAGKAYFYDSISKPMRYKEKSMELSKFFFMGFVEKGKRLALIESYIEELENELATLEQVGSAVDSKPEFDESYILALQEKGATSELTLTDVQEIALFQCAMLDLSIAKIKFEIQWFENFKKNL